MFKISKSDSDMEPRLRITPFTRHKNECSRNKGVRGLEDKGLDFRSLIVLGNKIQVREVGG